MSGRWSLAACSGCCYDPRERDVVIIKLRKHSPTSYAGSLAELQLSDGRMGWMDCIINHPATNADWWRQSGQDRHVHRRV